MLFHVSSSRAHFQVLTLAPAACLDYFNSEYKRHDPDGELHGFTISGRARKPSLLHYTSLVLGSDCCDYIRWLPPPLAVPVLRATLACVCLCAASPLHRAMHPCCVCVVHMRACMCAHTMCAHTAHTAHAAPCPPEDLPVQLPLCHLCVSCGCS